MAADRALRRLAAVLAIDMVGYSRHMEADEAGPAQRHGRDALRLSLRDPPNYWTFAFIGLAEFAAERYDEAAEWARKAMHLYRQFPTAHRLLAASSMQPGESEKARTALEGLLSVAPGATIARTRAGVPWKEPAVMERYLDALRRAGLPE